MAVGGARRKVVSHTLEGRHWRRPVGGGVGALRGGGSGPTGALRRPLLTLTVGLRLLLGRRCGHDGCGTHRQTGVTTWLLILFLLLLLLLLTEGGGARTARTAAAAAAAGLNASLKPRADH